jgi:hypothetical protein
MKHETSQADQRQSDPIETGTEDVDEEEEAENGPHSLHHLIPIQLHKKGEEGGK